MVGALSPSTHKIFFEGAEALLEGTGKLFTEEEKKMVHYMADIIIPRTDTPGAVDAKVPEFIVMMMQETYPLEDQDQFHSGLAAFDELCGKDYRRSFLKLSAEEREEAVGKLDSDILEKGKLQDSDLIFYRILKELTLLGFFTSETGSTETQRYAQVPGQYEPCVPYKKGEKTWASPG